MQNAKTWSSDFIAGISVQGSYGIQIIRGTQFTYEFYARREGERNMKTVQLSRDYHETYIGSTFLWWRATGDLHWLCALLAFARESALNILKADSLWAYPTGPTPL